MRILKILLLVCTFLNGNAQRSSLEAIDSMLLKLPGAPYDTNKVRLLYRISKAYQDQDIEKSTQFAKQSMAAAKALGWKKGMAANDILSGELLLGANKYDSAILHFKAAYATNTEINNINGILSALQSIGNVYYGQNNPNQALPYYLNALEMAEKHKNNDQICRINQNIAAVYLDQENSAKMLQYSQRSYAAAIKSGIPENTITSLESIGLAYLLGKDSTLAGDYFTRALALNERTDDVYRKANLYHYLALAKKSVSERIRYLLQAKELFDTYNPEHAMALSNLKHMGTAYRDSSMKITDPARKRKLLLQAEAYYEKVIAESKAMGHIDTYNDAESGLATVRAAKGEYRSAYELLYNYVQTYDSLYSQETKNKIATLENAREIDAREKQLQINKLALSNARRTRGALIAGSALLFIIGGLLFYQNQTRRKTNTTLLTLNNELDEANKIKTKFFGILSHDLRSPIANLINYLHLQKENPGLLDEQKKQYYQKNLATSAENLLDTMETMLLWSKSQMERFAPEKKIIPVDQLFEYLQKQIPAGSQVSLSFQNTGQLFVSTDEDYLKTIMYNLTANAFKALRSTPDGQIRWEARQNGNQVLLTITDNGPGIRQEQINALYNENAVVGTKHGLGLHLIRDLAKAIQCNISFHPAANGGACFTIAVRPS
ncbi:tetratricopeptide repeat-containing sensor histidine kinase [Niabella aurantiaca]|uniref:tetratricopeptide repeat-containing sensor histidine kinase n=1 Tax=Niabella aurantiaca TaxID=379900 RepID=UPI00035F0F5B|nr:tetratricopeptide repeat-containing sensor histidine kinase [Niabella aurantiaca]